MEENTSSNAQAAEGLSSDVLVEDPPSSTSDSEATLAESADNTASTEDLDEGPTAAAVEQPSTDPEPQPATPEGETLVAVEGLFKHYGPIKAVDGISFSVRRGEVLGFLGPNGAGKTTAMRLITGFLEPDAGRIEVAGHDLAGESLAARQQVGYLPENAPAYGEMTVHGFLEFVAEARGVADAESAITRVVAMTGLQKVVHQTIETLSKGYKRRVGLAQALIHDPAVLILDEPTDGLDPNQKAVVQNLLSSLAASKCIIISTHILDEVERICNRAMIISQGKILVDSTPHELLAQAPNHNTIRLTLQDDDPEFANRMAAESWCERVDAHSGSTFDIYPRGGENRLLEVLEFVKDTPVQDVRLQEGRLEDLFRQVTEGVTT